MNRLKRMQLKEITESVKENYLLNSLEESTSEIGLLKTKKFLNETTAIIEEAILEEGLQDKIAAFHRNLLAKVVS